MIEEKTRTDLWKVSPALPYIEISRKFKATENEIICYPEWKRNLF